MFALSQIVSLLSIVASVQSLNILVTNDDGFGASNIRELYRLLNAAGHNGLASMLLAQPMFTNNA
jgi:hypothetical protein